jgi:hypothetical protein
MTSQDVRVAAASDFATTPIGVHVKTRHRFEVAATPGQAREAAAASGASGVHPATRAAIAADRRLVAAGRGHSARGSIARLLHHRATAPTTAAGAARIVTAIAAGQAGQAGGVSRAVAGREGSTHRARAARATVRGVRNARGHSRRATAGRGGHLTASAARPNRAADATTPVSGGAVPAPRAPSKQRWPISWRPTRKSSRGGAR